VRAKLERQAASLPESPSSPIWGYADSADADPGTVSIRPVPREVTPRADGRIDLIGLARPQIAALLLTAGLDAKAAKLRAKQVFHWLYHRGVTDFEAMTDIAKTMRPWLAERFVIGRPEVVEAQVSTDGTRKWPPRRQTRTTSKWYSSLMPPAARCVSQARWAAPSIAASATPARCASCATLRQAKSFGQVDAGARCAR